MCYECKQKGHPCPYANHFGDCSLSFSENTFCKGEIIEVFLEKFDSDGTIYEKEHYNST